MKNIVIIGMPGSGKSTLGRLLAQKRGLAFFDADDVLEEREARSIKSFFAESEEAFRVAETRTLAYLAQMENAVIATGGGAVKKEENIRLLKKSGRIIFIDRQPGNIIGIISGDVRPLLAADKKRIFTLYDERIDLYRKYADFVVPNNDELKAAMALLERYAEEIEKEG